MQTATCTKRGKKIGLLICSSSPTNKNLGKPNKPRKDNARTVSPEEVKSWYFFYCYIIPTALELFYYSLASSEQSAICCR